MLQIPDPVSIRDEVARVAVRLRDACDESPASELEDSEGLSEALLNVLDALRQRAHSPDSEELSQTEPRLGDLGDHGIDLLARLADLARRVKLEADAEMLEGLTLPLACCVARAGGELSRIGPVVNAAAALANTLRDPKELTELYRLTDDVAQAVSMRITEAPPGSDDGRAWRVLVLNRAIIATRSQQPPLMEAAFDALLEALPADAPGFFREGVEQMDALNYPPAVRVVMQRYYDAWGVDRRLH
jgi:hypothetical protein